MAYYQDFTECDYCRNYEFACRLMAVGWIERGFPFDRGSVPEDFLGAFKKLRQGFQEMFFYGTVFRGGHECSLCGWVLDGSHLNLYVPHGGFIFLATRALDHYVEHHDYRPPDSFIESVYRCPDPRSIEYREEIKSSNRGYDAPEFFDGFRSRWHRT